MSAPAPAMDDSNRPLLTARVLGGIGEAAAADWDACAGRDNPFVSHAFLKALEDSGSATAETGWAPRHLVIEDAAGRVAGCAPMACRPGRSNGRPSSAPPSTRRSSTTARR